jgi:hypothetical protein
MSKLLAEKISNPAFDLAVSPVAQAVVELLELDGHDGLPSARSSR